MWAPPVLSSSSSSALAAFSESRDWLMYGEPAVVFCLPAVLIYSRQEEPSPLPSATPDESKIYLVNCIAGRQVQLKCRVTSALEETGMAIESLIHENLADLLPD
ncbi:hypothetical protein EJB05_12597, partial [Eragrostis curvula]